MATEGERITVSQSTLRAELAEMELRLRVWIASELDKKATGAEVSDIRTRVSALELSLTDPRIREMINSQITTSRETRDKEKWTPRERLIAVFLAILSTSTFVASLQPWTW